MANRPPEKAPKPVLELPMTVVVLPAPSVTVAIGAGNGVFLTHQSSSSALIQTW